MVDKRKFSFGLLKLFVLVLFTLNLYLFTSSTLKNTSSTDVKIELNDSNQRRIEIEQDILVNRNTNKYDDCNYMSSVSVKNKSLGGEVECDLLVTVKTTSSNYAVKVRAVLDTWFKLVPSKVSENRRRFSIRLLFR